MTDIDKLFEGIVEQARTLSSDHGMAAMALSWQPYKGVWIASVDFCGTQKISAEAYYVSDALNALRELLDNK